jgi:hypothetical protein
MAAPAVAMVLVAAGAEEEPLGVSPAGVVAGAGVVTGADEMMVERVGTPVGYPTGVLSPAG